MFLYSQDLSNCTTYHGFATTYKAFLYSQDLSNCTTSSWDFPSEYEFLYSQDLSNCTTSGIGSALGTRFCTLKI